MSTYWKREHYTQLSVEELQSKAEESAKKAMKKGRMMEPIIVHAKRGITETWWGNAWCDNLEQYADFSSRLDRGKRYVRTGTVIDLQIQKGKISARVQGRRKSPYKVEIHISPLQETQCQAIIAKCTHKVENLETLIQGQFPDDLKAIFTSEGGFFPTPNEISFSCSCPDWALMCKHVAAVLYGIGVRMDENPFLFFTLRGIDVNRFIDVAVANKVEKMLEHAENTSPRIMDDEWSSELFGL